MVLRETRFVARPIRFVARRLMLQCSDAWGKRQFKRQSSRFEIFLALASKLWTRSGQSTPYDVSTGMEPQMLNLLSIVFTGLVVGVLARFFYPGDVDIGMLKTILLGVGGALVAGLIASWRSKSTFGDGVNRAGCLASVLGAMLLIFIGRSL